MSTLQNIIPAQIMGLSVPERIQLVEDIWDTIVESSQEVMLSDAQRHELDRRIDAYQRNPGEGSSWSEVRERIRSRR